jgi:glutaredoxin-like YruB-family protein
MKQINSLQALKTELGSSEKVWLLLFKKGSQQSDCAFENFKLAEKEAGDNVLSYADVNMVKDIHTTFKITTVPSLISFENGELKNVVKGCHQPEQFNTIFKKSAFIASGTDEEKIQRNVTVYTTPTCSWCTTIKRHLDENGVRYREVNVAADQKAAEEMVKKSGQQGVPQTDINGQIIVGFDKTRINSLLGIQ